MLNVTQSLCRSFSAIGVKAPSHISEYYVPLRIAACTSRTTRFILSLRDPVARAYSSWTYKYQFLYKAHEWPKRFAHAVALERGSLRHVDLSNRSTFERGSASSLWLELYVRLLWQEYVGGHTSVMSSGMVKCNPLEYGGHDKLAGLIKSIYAPQLRHWLGTFKNDCSRFLITGFEAHTATHTNITARVLRQTLAFLGLDHLAFQVAAVTGPSRESKPAHSSGTDSPMWNETKADLYHWFRPANAALATLLEKHCQRVPLMGPVSGGGLLELPSGITLSRSQWLLQDSSEAFRIKFIGPE